MPRIVVKYADAAIAPAIGCHISRARAERLWRWRRSNGFRANEFFELERHTAERRH
jgi:hypothetical protein